MIIVVLCIVILCIRRSRGKGDNKDIYSTSKHNTDVNVTMNNNPSYDVHTKPYSKTSEDEYNYVQPNDVDGYIKIYPTTGQSHGIRDIHSHSTANSTNEEEYGVVNQPQN